MQASLPRTFRKRRLIFWRRLTLSASFSLLILIPLVNLFLGITFIQGWYQSLGIGKLRIVSPLEGLQSILVTNHVHLPALVGMLIPVVLALLLGRVFCSWICPISFFAETRSLFHHKEPGRHCDHFTLPRQALWFTLAADMFIALILGAPLFVFLSPPGLVGRELMLMVLFHTFALEGLVVAAVLTLELLARRFFCRSLCPLGALLALFGSRRKLRIQWHADTCTACGRCDDSCPLGLSPSRGEAASLYCWNCGLCLDKCPHKALALYWQRSP